MTQEFTAKDFFFSAKGRLNRKPYNIALIVFVCMTCLLSLTLAETFLNLSPSTLSDLQKSGMSAKDECIEASKKLFQESSLSHRYVERCVKEKTLPFIEKIVYENPKTMIPFGIIILLYLLMMCPTIKRFHDRGKSGWWYLIFTIAAFIPFIDIVALVWFLAETSFLRGTVGPNAYGPDPLA